MHCYGCPVCLRRRFRARCGWPTVWPAKMCCIRCVHRKRTESSAAKQSGSHFRWLYTTATPLCHNEQLSTLTLRSRKQLHCICMLYSGRGRNSRSSGLVIKTNTESNATHAARYVSSSLDVRQRQTGLQFRTSGMPSVLRVPVVLLTGQRQLEIKRAQCWCYLMRIHRRWVYYRSLLLGLNMLFIL